MNFVDPSGYKKRHHFWQRVLAIVAVVLVAVLLPEGFAAAHPFLSAAISAAAGATGAAVGAQVDRAMAHQESVSTSASESHSPRGPPSAFSGVPAEGPSATASSPGSPLSPPQPWLQPFLRTALDVAKQLANWDVRTASVVEAAEGDDRPVISRTIPGPSGEPVPIVRNPVTERASVGFPPSVGTAPPNLGQALFGNPARALRVVGRTFAETGHPLVGRLMGTVGNILEPGGPGKIYGMIVGGNAGALIGRTVGRTVGGVIGGFVFGAAGGFVGSLFDPPGAGEPE